MSILINIIIPCYYSSERIKPCFESLANQTCKDIINIIMVNDCSPNTECEYQDIRDEFSSQLQLTYIKTPKNLGPGAARQFGLNSINNNAEYVMFIDDDDRLYNNQVIEHYYQEILQKTDLQIYATLTGYRTFVENNDYLEQKDIQYTGLTGSVFNYNIISMFNITFEPSRYDEDSLFFAQYFFYCSLLEFYLFNLPIILIHKQINKYCYVYTTDNLESLTHDSKYTQEHPSWYLLELVNKELNFYLNYCNYFPHRKIITRQIKEYFYIFTIYFTQLFLEQKSCLDDKYEKSIQLLNLQVISLLNILNINYIDTESLINEANLKFLKQRHPMQQEFINFNSVYDYLIFIQNNFLLEGDNTCSS